MSTVRACGKEINYVRAVGMTVGCCCGGCRRCRRRGGRAAVSSCCGCCRCTGCYDGGGAETRARDEALGPYLITGAQDELK